MNSVKIVIVLFVSAVLFLMGIQCSECPKICGDVRPPVGPRQIKFSCKQQKMFGQCEADFMQGYCLCTCGTCDKYLDSIMMTGPMTE